MTSVAMEWLNQNRYRSYPMRSPEWRQVAPADSGLDCILLDALVFDCDAATRHDLLMSGASVYDDRTVVSFEYGGDEFDVTLEGGSSSGPDSYDCIRGSVGPEGGEGRRASVSLSFSSHAYIRETLGNGTWKFGVPVLRSRVCALSDGFGVDYLSTNGSSGVEGRESPARASGDVVLEDGYRTSPVVLKGQVFVRVGRRYGMDPCRFDYGEAGSRDCRKPLFFFCGQNAVNSGNVVLKGGRGVGVSSGGVYAIRGDAPSKCAGMSIPCIEISAGRELMDLYPPPEQD